MLLFFFFKQKTAYEMRISDWSSDVCSSDLYLRAVTPKMKNATISVLHVPGIGTLDELRMAADCGAGCVHVATHCTEADVSEQHIGLGRQLGLDTVGFLRMAQLTPVDAFVPQATLTEG